VKLFQFDEGYLERLREGDPLTEQHFTDYFTELMGIKLRARRYAQAEVDDIRQETFLRVFRAVRSGKIREAVRVGSYVNSVCNNVAMEQRREVIRHPQADSETQPDVPDGHAGPETELLTAEEGGIVRRVLEEIPGRSREILSKLYLEERPAEEVCASFNVDQNYLRVLLFRARKQFRQALEKRGKFRTASHSSETDGE
jgi:RNA polymerase sigma-70 factor (ECF subfamily)